MGGAKRSGVPTASVPRSAKSNTRAPPHRILMVEPEVALWTSTATWNSRKDSCGHRPPRPRTLQDRARILERDTKPLEAIIAGPFPKNHLHGSGENHSGFRRAVQMG